ncbi:MAG: hypothetical protein HOM68_02775 [Gemmatimonadetes bacterium]|nr:hypothetical protein [Gemmatimonadota bacterium]MBT4611288.1 hypothetical protein [Gemmatimonadota bacterium]MBT5055442.1 hypothetical protein [Gemmatimonadota bacterium]MBT5143438.1 hypothetical protein [Gemmatimonadota bacterium]MBT5589346.1 hypothetical protein [Gemmatimonadota bacterium]
MKRPETWRVLRLLLLPLVLPWAEPLDAGQIVGSIDLPAPAPQRRSYRGAQYRGRLAPQKQAAADSTKTRSLYDDVVVSAHPLSFIAAVDPLPEPPQMEQYDAQFRPRVLPITVNTRVVFVNRDPYYHNVFSFSPTQDFDIGRKPTGEEVGQMFPMAGQVDVFCDIHPQMSGTIVVLDTPYFTQPDSVGGFVLDGLPAGQYALRIFHPKHETPEQQIDVDEGTPVRLQINIAR